MISVPYQSAFGNFSRSNAPDTSPDGEVVSADLSVREEVPVDMSPDPHTDEELEEIFDDGHEFEDDPDPHTPEEVEEIFNDGTEFEDDPVPSKFKNTALLSVVGGAGLLYLGARLLKR